MKNEDLNFEASSNIDNEDDDETEKEAIELLKAQHEQIQQLKSQNENKDKMIKMMKNQIVTDVTIYVNLRNGVKNIVEEHTVGIVMSEPNLSKMENKNYEID